MEHSDLQTGLAALKKKNYEMAIAILEKVCEQELHQPTVDRATMGLVMAYKGNRTQSKAIALCQTLTESDSPKVKDWAVRTLYQLNQSSPSAPESQPQIPKTVNRPGSSPSPLGGDPTGFVPLNPSSSGPAQPSPLKNSNSQDIISPLSLGNPTGFVPLEPAQAKPAPRSPVNPPPLPPHKPPAPHKPPRPPVPRQDSPQVLPLEVDAEGFDYLTPSKTEADSPSAMASEDAQPFPTPPELTVPTPQPRQWRQAGRAQNWRKLKPVKPTYLLFAQIGSAIALFWLLRILMNWGMATANDLFHRLPLLWPIQSFYRDQTWTLLGILVLLLIASPWLLDLLLRFAYGMEKLPPQKLGNYSSEARKLLSRFSVERKQPALSLGVIPTDAPIAMTYGFAPRFARIVVSQGLLEQLEEDEIAAIYAGELGHLENWDFTLMSLAMLLCQVPYVVYWQVSRDGDKWLDSQEWSGRVMLGTAGVISAIAYGFYWVLRWPVLFLSRLRFYYSDRVSASLTGNPNALTRALLKMAVGIAQDVEKQGQTSFVLEGFDLLSPVGYVQGMTLGSCSGYDAWENILEWDRHNAYKKWLSFPQSHPPLGDRLTLLDLYARFWKLDTELDFASDRRVAPAKSPRWMLKRLLLQGAPYFGLPLGLLAGLMLWVFGAVAVNLGLRELDWVWGDRSILQGSLLIGVSLGIFLRINSFFPDITSKNIRTNPTLPDLLTDPDAIPVDSLPIGLEGQLLGRRGLSNWLAQDLILQSPTGLVKLHAASNLGVFGYLWLLAKRPSDLVGQTISAIGWFRRGATPWIDLDRFTTPDGKTHSSAHPIWSTILAAVAVLLGVYWMSKGGT
ncbi:M48 family metalloprotease [Phormidium pseudopriestleyi FRX01]|uniref:M48 family metalloprotease n=1 Tax=Phormidium pseudopriestleyi FRX01 TaxID=1759528 RepID=A0ABS3FTJ9_9CYAN|nr:M48 family metalloprotease [Phormidium pseudopriestleyi]MBO0350444.1 M48 family metalloprotease [Phormidium pseudopriestleyi FRX01]